MLLNRTTRLIISWILVVFLGSGCSLANLGVRPNNPGLTFSPEVLARCDNLHTKATDLYRGCLEFYDVIEWGNNLEEAYRSRATLNEWWIYFAGTLGLASLGATGGIAATGHGASEVAKIIPIGGGFLSGFMGFLNNSAKAHAYTEAANTISEALAEAAENVSGNNPPYKTARATLYKKIAKAKNDLEIKRSEGASAAANKQTTEELQKVRNDVEQLRLDLALRDSTVTGINPATIPSGTGGDVLIRIAFSGPILSQIRPSDISVKLDELDLGLQDFDRKTNTIQVNVPPKEPVTGKKQYQIKVYVKKDQMILPNKTLTYP